MAHCSITFLLIQLVRHTACVYIRDVSGDYPESQLNTNSHEADDDHYRPSAPSIALYPEGKIPGVQIHHPRKETWTAVNHSDPIFQKCGRVDPKGSSKVRWLYNVTQPTLTPYVVSASNPLRSDVAVVVVPGGGLRFLALDTEGGDYAQWLNSIGISAFVLKYRVPSNVDYQISDFQVMDVQRSLSLVRWLAPKYRLNPQRVGLIGSSAGGALSILGSLLKGRAYRPIDQADEQPARADFALLLYPQIPNVKEDKPKGTEVVVQFSQEPPETSVPKVKLEAPDVPVTLPEVDIFPEALPDHQAPLTEKLGSLFKESGLNPQRAPPTFIALAENDPCTPAPRAMAYYDLLRSHNGQPSELHVFPSGGHGYGRCATFPEMKWYEVCTWTRNAQMFLHSIILQDVVGEKLPTDWEGPVGFKSH